MNKLFKFLILITIVSTLMLVGCDNDGRNPISGEKVPEKTVSTEAPTEISTEAPTEINTEQDIESQYRSMFDDKLTVDLNSKNIVATISTQDSNVLEVEQSSSGNSKNVMTVGDKAKYIVYNIGEDSYLEIHISEQENKEAEDLYYKITNNKFLGDASLVDKTDIENLINSMQLSSENISSVKYLGDQNIHGVDCDAVEIKHRIEKDGDVINNKTLFYFTDWNIIHGLKFSTSTNTIDFYFPDSLKIELPKDVEFVEVDDSVINAKIAILYSSGLLNIKLS